MDTLQMIPSSLTFERLACPEVKNVNDSDGSRIWDFWTATKGRINIVGQDLGFQSLKR